MQTKSFYEVLEAQIRAELLPEIEKEVREKLQKQSAPFAKKPARDAVEAAYVPEHQEFDFWLELEKKRNSFVSPKPRSSAAYANFKSSQKASTGNPKNVRAQVLPTEESSSEAKPKIYTAKTTQELAAFQLLTKSANRRNDDSYSFTASELKSLWRQAAFNSHPDRLNHLDAKSQANASHHFRDLNAAYKILMGVECS